MFTFIKINIIIQYIYIIIIIIIIIIIQYTPFFFFEHLFRVTA